MRGRFISEFIAILVIITVAIASIVIFYSYVNTLMSKAEPKMKYVDVSVVGAEITYAGTGIELDLGVSTYRAFYIFRYTVVLHNVGNQPVYGLTFKTIDIDDYIDVCTSDSCEVYDPVAFTKRYSKLPEIIKPNQAVQIVFTVPTKVNLLKLRNSPFVISVKGFTPDGTVINVFIDLVGG